MTHVLAVRNRSSAPWPSIVGASPSMSSQSASPAAFALRTVSPTARALTPRLFAASRWLRPSSHFCLRISFASRMDSRSVGMATSYRGAVLQGTHPASSAPSRTAAPVTRKRPPTDPHGGVITMADLGDHDADLGDHDQPIQVITMDRRAHSCRS